MTAERSVAPHQTEVGRAGQWSPACPHCRALLFLRERGEETQMGQTPELRPQLLEGGREEGWEGGRGRGRDRGKERERGREGGRVSEGTHIHVLYICMDSMQYVHMYCPCTVCIHVHVCTCTCTVYVLNALPSPCS